jgi:hypothetical protein
MLMVALVVQRVFWSAPLTAKPAKQVTYAEEQTLKLVAEYKKNILKDISTDGRWKATAFFMKSVCQCEATPSIRTEIAAKQISRPLLTMHCAWWSAKTGVS